MRKECKECKDSGLLYDPVLKDSQLIKLCDLNPEVKKIISRNYDNFRKTSSNYREFFQICRSDWNFD